MTDRIEGQRRQFVLGGLAAAATGSLAGCAFRPNRPAVQPHPALLPAEPPAGAMRLIDAHGHFFNARDVQAVGYLLGPVAHSYPKYARLLKALAC